MKKIISTLILCIGMAILGQAQEASPYVIATAGDYFSNNDFSISWTLGETVTETIGTDDVILTQGFQQPSYEIGSAVPQYNDNRFSIKAFPNPARNYLKIQVKGNENTDLNIEFFDAIGRKLINARMESGTAEMELNLTPYHPGMYFLKVSSPDGNPVRTYQISKAVR